MPSYCNSVCVFSESRMREICLSGCASRKRLVCSVRDRPTKVIVRGLVAWIAERREIEFLMPIDKAIFRLVSKSSGRNESERRLGLEAWRISTQRADCIRNRMTIRDKDMNKQMSTVRGWRDVLDIQTRETIVRTAISQGKVQRSLYLSAELLRLP